MAVKLVLLLLILALVVSLAVLGTFWYLNQESEREHEKELTEMEKMDEWLE